MPALQVITGPLAGTRITLPKKREIVVGRDQSCDIVIARGSVSRRHARFVCHPDGVFVEDLKSINGTFVNSKKANKLVALHEGDRINVHDVCIVFISDEHTPEPNATDSYFGQVVIPDLGRDGKAHAPEVKVQAVSMVHSAAAAPQFAKLHERFARTLEADDVLPSILDILFQAIPPLRNGRIMYVGDDDKLHPRALKHGRDEDSAVLSMAPVDDEIAAQVVATRKAVVMSQVDPESALDDPSTTVTFPIVNPSSTEAVGVIHLEIGSDSWCMPDPVTELFASASFLAWQAHSIHETHSKLLESERDAFRMVSAQKVQLRLLPTSLVKPNGYSLTHHYTAAKDVGGDFFCSFKQSDDKVIIGVGDVCGKGVAAALTMAELVTEIRHAVGQATTVRQAMAQLNRVSYQREMGFVTFMMCVLDPVNHTISVANAGHLPPLCRRAATAKVEQLQPDKGGVPFALLEEQDFHLQTFPLAKGDLVLLCTDGIHEATNGAGHLYGFDRTKKLMANEAGPPEDMIRAIVEDITNFRGSAEQNDDMCLVCFQRVS